MTAGEHSDRGYGRDDQDNASYSGPEGGRGRHPWPSDQTWPGQPAWPGHQEEPPGGHQQGGYSPPGPYGHGGADQSGGYGGADPYGHGGGAQPGGFGYFDPPARYGDAGQPEGYGDPARDGSYGYPDRDGAYGGDAYGGDAYGGDAYGGDAYGGSLHGDRTGAYRQPADSGWSGARHSDATHSWQRPADEPDAGDAASGGRRGRGGRGGRGRRRGLPLWQEIPLLLVIAFCLALLVRTFLLQAFYIPSGSMEETLLAGDRVLVNKIVYQAREPARGEVVVFRGTDAWAPQFAIDSDIGMFSRVGRALGDLVGISRPTEKDYIKRIVGLPGDRVSCCDVEGRVFVNGQPLDEDYVLFDAPLNDAPEGEHDCRSRRFDEVVVEPGQMFVMGDHRAISQDSRCQGQVPLDNVIGRAFVIVWPSGRWGSLSAPETFASVPAAAGAHETAPAGPSPAETALVVPLLLTAAATIRPWGRVPGVPGRADVVSSRGD